VLACLLALGLNGFALRILWEHSDSRSDRFCSAQRLRVLIGILGPAWPLWRSARLKTVEAIRHL
jgi:hypothetical protein